MSAVFARFTLPGRGPRRLLDRRHAFSAAPKPRRSLPCRPIRGTPQVCRASAEATAMLSAGLEKWVAGDRMGALTYFEDCLKADPSPEVRMAALWNSTAVHAYFGDAEVAQISLREAVALGLDFEAALLQSDPRFVKLQASAQIIIQLRRFAQATARALAAGGAQAAPSGKQRAAAGGAREPYRTPGLSDDVSGLTKTDMQGIDTSLLGVVRRVALLLVALIGLGVGLFYVGLQLTFPGEQ